MKYLFLLILAFPVMASENHNTTIFTEGQKGDTGAPGVNASNLYRGVAIGIATAQHNFDFGTYELQGSVGVGSYDTAEAASFALGKRFNRVMINGSVGAENGKLGLGAGFNWRF